VIWVACDPSFSSCIADRVDGVDVLDLRASGGRFDRRNGGLPASTPKCSTMRRARAKEWVYKQEIRSRWDQSYRPHYHITILTKQINKTNTSKNLIDNNARDPIRPL
jgi:hypothetical protein